MEIVSHHYSPQRFESKNKPLKSKGTPMFTNNASKKQVSDKQLQQAIKEYNENLQIIIDAFKEALQITGTKLQEKNRHASSLQHLKNSQAQQTKQNIENNRQYMREAHDDAVAMQEALNQLKINHTNNQTIKQSNNKQDQIKQENGQKFINEVASNNQQAAYNVIWQRAGAYVAFTVMLARKGLLQSMVEKRMQEEKELQEMEQFEKWSKENSRHLRQMLEQCEKKVRQKPHKTLALLLSLLAPYDVRIHFGVLFTQPNARNLVNQIFSLQPPSNSATPSLRATLKPTTEEIQR